MKPHRSPLPKSLDASEIRLEPGPDATFRVTAHGRSMKGVTLRLGRPLTAPDAFLALLSADGEDLSTVWNLSRLSASSRAVLNAWTAEHVFPPKITKIRSVVYQFGCSQWTVETDRGPKEFVIKGTSEHVRWLSDDRLVIRDVDEKRYEIVALSALDRKSRAEALRVL